MVNYNHMMPTRYSVDISFDKANINKELLKVTHVKEMDRVPHTRPCHVPAGVTWLLLGPCGSGQPGLRG